MELRALKVRLVAIMVVTGFCVTAAVATAALVSVRSSQNSSLGAILVSSSGRTLYHLSSEKGTIKCTGMCAAEWPPLLIGAGAKPIAQPGVTAKLLGTIKRPDGKVQVTYRGLALYTYAGDKKAGDVKGQGVNDIWHAIAPSGVVITKTVSTSTSTGTASGSNTNAGSGSGSGSSSYSGSSGSSGSNSSGSGGGTSTVPQGCDTNPGGYGCM
jgi:predicted lipoprotein with Yx(FWY)xxD motif